MNAARAPRRVTWRTDPDEMTRSARPTERLLLVAEHGSRRQRYSASTERALIDVARERLATEGPDA